MRVHRAGDNLAVVVSKLRNAVGEGDKFCWTDKGEVQWIEEKEDPFALDEDKKTQLAFATLPQKCTARG